MVIIIIIVIVIIIIIIIVTIVMIIIIRADLYSPPLIFETWHWMSYTQEQRKQIKLIFDVVTAKPGITKTPKTDAGTKENTASNNEHKKNDFGITENTAESNEKHKYAHHNYEHYNHGTAMHCF